jgi:hypothetical protein
MGWWKMNPKTPTKTTADLFIDAEKTYRKGEEITIVSPKAKMTKREFRDSNLYYAGFQEGSQQTLKDELEFLKTLFNYMDSWNWNTLDEADDCGSYEEFSLKRDIENKIKQIEKQLGEMKK